MTSSYPPFITEFLTKPLSFVSKSEQSFREPTFRDFLHIYHCLGGTRYATATLSQLQREKYRDVMHMDT